MEKCEDEGSGWKWWSWTELSPVSYMLLNGFMGQIKSNETIQINWGQPSVVVNWSSYIEVTLISNRQHNQHSLTLSDSFFTKTTIIPPQHKSKPPQYIVSIIPHRGRHRTKQRVTKCPQVTFGHLMPDHSKTIYTSTLFQNRQIFYIFITWRALWGSIVHLPVGWM